MTTTFLPAFPSSAAIIPPAHPEPMMTTSTLSCLVAIVFLHSNLFISDIPVNFQVLLKSILLYQSHPNIPYEVLNILSFSTPSYLYFPRRLDRHNHLQWSFVKGN